MKRSLGQSPDPPSGNWLEVGSQVVMSCHTTTGRRVFSCTLVEPTALHADLVVAWPRDSRNEPAAILPAETMLLEVSHAYDALYLIEAQIAIDLADGTERLRLRSVGPWNRVQRRRDVRLTAMIVPRVADLVTGSGAREPLAGYIRDVSAGGILLRCERDLEPGELIDLAFALPDDDRELATTVIVGRVARVEQPRFVAWDIGCRFVSLPEVDRDRVVRFIFAEQREIARIRRNRTYS